MIEKHGDMWSYWDYCDLFLIASNSIVRNDGALVMGAGMANEACHRFRGINFALGNRVKKTVRSGGKFGLLISPSWPDKKLGLFQVQKYWGSPADKDLVALSIDKLSMWMKKNPDSVVYLNFPTVGKESISSMKHMFEPLSDNLVLWLRE